MRTGTRYKAVVYPHYRTGRMTVGPDRSLSVRRQVLAAPAIGPLAAQRTVLVDMVDDGILLSPIDREDPAAQPTLAAENIAVGNSPTKIIDAAIFRDGHLATVAAAVRVDARDRVLARQIIDTGCWVGLPAEL